MTRDHSAFFYRIVLPFLGIAFILVLIVYLYRDPLRTAWNNFPVWAAEKDEQLVEIDVSPGSEVPPSPTPYSHTNPSISPRQEQRRDTIRAAVDRAVTQLATDSMHSDNEEDESDQHYSDSTSHSEAISSSQLSQFSVPSPIPSPKPTPDTTPPDLQLMMSDAPGRVVTEWVQNPSFEEGMSHWSSQESAAVTILSQDSFATAPHGQMMARIGDVEDPGQSAEINVLRQSIPKQARSISFLYNFHTTDVAPFDEPGMFVYVNDREVLQLWAQDLNPSLVPDGSVYSTGWQRAHVFLGDVGAAELKIAFHAGNGPNQAWQQSWLYLDDVRTTDVVASTTEVMIAQSDEIVHRDLLSQAQDSSWREWLYWAQDAVGNRVEQQWREWLDSNPPSAPQNVELFQQQDEEWLVVLDAPGDAEGRVAGYELRLSNDEDNWEEKWQQLPQPEPVERSYPAPRPEGSQQQFVIEIPSEYYSWFLGIRAVDEAGNYSPVSVASLVQTAQHVKITEVMIDPDAGSGDWWQDDEWIEIYNGTQELIDVDNWYLRDRAGNVLRMDSGNVYLSETTRSTQLQQKSTAVIHLSQDILNNTGDTIEIFERRNGGGGDLLHDKMSYTAGQTSKGLSLSYDTSVQAWVSDSSTPFHQYISDSSSDQRSPLLTVTGENEEDFQVIFHHNHQYETVEYTLSYSHYFDHSRESVKRDAFRGSRDLSDEQEPLWVLDQFPFETCSGNGKHCILHQNIHDVTVTADLYSDQGHTRYVSANGLPRHSGQIGP